MQAQESKGYWALLGLTTALAVLAVVTMLPNPGAAKPNVLGYRSVCSFAPAASALCGLLAGLTCTIRNRRFSANAASMRYRPLILPIAVGLLLLALAVVFGLRFISAELRFGSVIAKTESRAQSVAALADGTRSATFSEGEVSATVELAVAAGKITGIRLAGGKNIPGNVAARIFDEVKAKGSTAVDAVSGATASSNVLLRAIEAAAVPRGISAAAGGAP
jgi:uncharacterized protein with FMN-binding domain